MTRDEVIARIERAAAMQGRPRFVGENLVGLDLRGATLGGADLRWADLSEATLGGADLSGADLSEATLRGANLRGADLSGADLSEATLRGANLRGADLSEANLREADLREANLRGATLRGALGVYQIGPGGSRGDMLTAYTALGLRVMTGCFYGTLDEFLAAVERTHGDNPHGRYYRAAAEMIRVWYETYEKDANVQS